MRSCSVLAAAAVLIAAPALAGSPLLVDQSCGPHLVRAAREARLPEALLPAMALVESGRLVEGRLRPWPWTVDVDGQGHFYASKTEAVAAVKAFETAGAKWVDVGCMQINLQMHPNAFASLDQAFDPGANTRYGAQFLRALYAASGQWNLAITAYHSKTPMRAAAYARKVLAIWPGAAALGLTAEDAPQSAIPPEQAPRQHDYTEAFARRVAADLAMRRAVMQRMGAVIHVRSLLRVEPPGRRHGPAWPRGVP